MKICESRFVVCKRFYREEQIMCTCFSEFVSFGKQTEYIQYLFMHRQYDTKQEVFCDVRS